MSEVRNLTQDEIKVILAKYPKARHIPVSNFLSSMEGPGMAVAQNFHQDSRDYRWDTHITKAIQTGIDIAKGYKRIVDGKIK
jgi:hypothetical protein